MKHMCGGNRRQMVILNRINLIEKITLKQNLKKVRELSMWIQGQEASGKRETACGEADVARRLERSKPGLPALGAWSLNHCATREAP